MATVLVLLSVGILGLGGGRALWQRPLPTFKQLTFRQGFVLSAFFTSDGQTVVYSATWDGQPPGIFSMRVESPESLPLDLPPARLLGVSSLGELAILLTPPGDAGAYSKGTLARAPLSGGVPRPVLEDVYTADWSPDGHDLAVVRDVAGGTQLEYPVGNVLKRLVGSGGPMQVRVAPQGDRVVLNSRSQVSLFDRAGHERHLKLPATAVGVAWAPAGDAIWASAGESWRSRGLWRVTPEGDAREVFRMAGTMALHDVSKDGRVLLRHGLMRLGVRAKPPGESTERELGVFDWSVVVDLTPDGTQLLLSEQFSTSTAGAVFLRSTRGGPPVRLGEGFPLALSPDGRWALIAFGNLSKHPRLVLTPTGPGEARDLPVDHLERQGGGWFAGPSAVVLYAGEPGRPDRTFVMNLSGGEPRPVTPEGIYPAGYSDHDGSVIGCAADGALARYPLVGGEPQPLSARLPHGATPIRLSRDGQSLLIFESGPVPARVERLDLTTGGRTLWKVLRPDDAAGVALLDYILVSPDEQTYAYAYGRFLQDLYLVEGLR
jgi:hypothetical protein